MAEAYLVDAVRTPVGRRGGGLAGVHPADLGAHVIRALLARTGVDPLAVDDVVFGCVDTIGPQAGDIARTAWLAAGLPEAVPGVTVDRQCGSSQQAVHFAAQAVLSGTADLVLAGGVQNMSHDPHRGRDARRAGVRVRRPVLRVGRLAGQVRRAGDLPVPRRRHDRREVGDRPRRDGAVRAGQPRARGRGGGRGRFRGRDRALRRGGGRRVPAAGHLAGEDGRAGAAARGRPDHRGAVQPDRRRRGRAACRLGPGGPRARAAPAGPDPPPVRARRRPGDDAHRADRGDRARAGAGPG